MPRLTIHGWSTRSIDQAGNRNARPVGVNTSRPSGCAPSTEPHRRAAGRPDPVGLPDLTPLDRAIGTGEWILHAATQDLPCLRELGLAPRQIFDTELAARLLGLPAGRLDAGAPADLVLFDPDAPFVLDRARLRSKSKNTPYDLRRMQGRVLRSLPDKRVVVQAQGQQVTARAHGIVPRPGVTRVTCMTGATGAGGTTDRGACRAGSVMTCA